MVVVGFYEGLDEVIIIIIIIIIADGTWSNWQRSTPSVRSGSEINVVASNPACEKKFSSGSLANVFSKPSLLHWLILISVIHVVEDQEEEEEVEEEVEEEAAFRNRVGTRDLTLALTGVVSGMPRLEPAISLSSSL